MIQAVTGEHGQLALATPNIAGRCPQCDAPVRPKCGSLVVWHWAHHARADCDVWSEPESQWHRDWKLAVPMDRREVVIGPHRADMVAADGTVVELQHSTISTATIEERERFYGNMRWVFDVADCADRLTVVTDWPGHDVNYARLRWARARKHVAWTRKPTYLDWGSDELLLLAKLNLKGIGDGHLIPRAQILEWLNCWPGGQMAAF